MIFVLNLFLVCGVGSRAGAFAPGTTAGIDATVRLSAANALMFIWFGRQIVCCLDGAAPAATKARGDIPRPRESSSR